VSREIGIGADMNQIIRKKQAGMTLVALVLALQLLAAWGPSQGISKAPGKSKPIIVIDPGHGGNDGGAKGTGGTIEKDVTLALAREIAKCLKSNYKPVLTRTGDYWLDTTGRTAVANHHKAALFISIHASGSFLHQAGGAAVYYYKDVAGVHTSSEHGTSLSLSESLQGDDDPLVWDEVQAAHLPASKLAAETLGSELVEWHVVSECKVRGAPLAVLTGADMPAALLEIGYLSNPSTEKKLIDDSYLSELARAVCSGIDDYF